MKKERYYCVRKDCFWGSVAIGVLLVVVVLFAKFGKKQEADSLNKTAYTEYAPILSELNNPDECYFCGHSSNSLMEYYRQFDTIGIVGLNEWCVLDLGLKKYDSDWNVETEQEGSSDVYGRLQGVEYKISSTSSRGMARAKICSANGMFQEQVVKENLCQKCLDKVVDTLARDMTEEQKEYFPFCVVDFKTLELYPVQRDGHSYFIRDYWVKIQIQSNDVYFEVYYLPESADIIKNFD